MNLLFAFRKHAGLLTFGVETKQSFMYLHLFPSYKYWNTWGNDYIMIAGIPLWIFFAGPFYILSWSGK